MLRRSAFLLLVVTGLVCYCQADPLDSLPGVVADYRAMRVSSYDRTGGNGDALTGIQPNETRTLAEIDGPGVITHIWITIGAEKWHGRKLVLRMFWDGEENPSVLTPINDFFCMGHGIEAPMWSLPITTTADGRARNSFFRMPFQHRARIEVTNDGLEPVGAFYYYIDYRKYNKPLDQQAYFHAQYNQTYPAEAGKNYVILDAKGRGHYVGTVYSIESHSEGWWGEGDDRFFIDGETTPSLHGTGSEDYLCDAWGIWKGNSPYFGCSIHEGKPYIYPANTRYTSYRFHIEDPVPFQKSLHLEIEHMGAGVVNGAQNGYIERFDNLSSVAYWYQVEPHKKLQALAHVDQRLPDEAAEEKQLLGFLRMSAENPLTTSIESLRAMHDEVKKSSSGSKRSDLLAIRMARAEVSSGNVEKAKKLVEPFGSAFVTKQVGKEIQPLAGSLGIKLTSSTLFVVAVDDGSTSELERENRKGLSTDQGAKRQYVYFALPDDSPLKEGNTTATVRVSYYSEGRPKDAFRIEYDSVDQAYRASVDIQKPEQKGWFEAEIHLGGAHFAGRQNNGADLRIDSKGDGDEILGNVEMVGPPGLEPGTSRL